MYRLLPVLLAPLWALAACADDTEPAVDAGADVAVVDAAPPDLAAPHTITLFDRTRINSKGTTNLRQAEAEFAFDRGPYSSVTLEVALESSCYPFDKWKTNPPPAGQNWPADCDAFDRNFEFHMDPAGSATDPPGYEWVRSITPFGGPLSYTVDLTDLANGLPGKHTARVSISTYSDAKGIVSGSNGGWWVTGKLKLVPGKAPRDVLAVTSLFNETFTSDSSKRERSFKVPAGTKSSRVEYRVTGHGGASVADPACIGGAEEFCQRWHKIYVDGVEAKQIAPWRKDCDTLCTPTSGTLIKTYCKENPCGAIGSVKAPRANWCPGSVTPPITWSFSELARAGDHTFGYMIEKVAKGGSWQVSATYYAYGE